MRSVPTRAPIHDEPLELIYIACDLADWRDERGVGHVRGASNHLQTQGKIER